MITIQWKGKIGYGDILSPICYAHNVSYQQKCQVKLIFKWGKPAEYKYNENDPEPLWQRADFLSKLCSKKQNRVVIEHDFKNSLRVNHTNYDWDVVGSDVFHNYWMPTTKNTNTSDLIIINPTTRNAVTLKSLKRGWKDPMADKWGEIIDTLSRQNAIRVIDFRTPIQEATELLRNAKGFVGYHGGMAWVARFMHTPSLIFSDGGSLSRNAFFYNAIESSPEKLPEILPSVSKYLNYSRRKIDTLPERYDAYKMSNRFVTSLKHDA